MEDRLEAAYSKLAGMRICAGVKDDVESARKAKMNHYGWFRETEDGNVMQIPQRSIILAAVAETHDEQAEMANDIIEAIKANIKNPTYSTYTYRFGRTEKEDHSVRTSTGNLFGVGSQTPKRIGEKLAKAMAGRIDTAIGNISFFEPNRPATVARKHAQAPLLETGDMLSNIQGWVE